MKNLDSTPYHYMMSNSIKLEITEWPAFDFILELIVSGGATEGNKQSE